jgi:hypothetical protein
MECELCVVFPDLNNLKLLKNNINILNITYYIYIYREKEREREISAHSSQRTQCFSIRKENQLIL